jgi:hypothetical protein
MRWEEVMGTKAVRTSQRKISCRDLILKRENFEFSIREKVCVVTGSRAEYGILRGLMKAIKDDPELQLQIIATNQHLSKLQGETYKEIERGRLHH